MLSTQFKNHIRKTASMLKMLRFVSKCCVKMEPAKLYLEVKKKLSKKRFSYLPSQIILGM